jgi:hypothetical protein
MSGERLWRFEFLGVKTSLSFIVTPFVQETIMGFLNMQNIRQQPPVLYAKPCSVLLVVVVVVFFFN